MADFQAGFQWTAVSAAGTTALKADVAYLVRVLIPGTYTGTVNFHDAASAAGTTTTSQIYSLGIPTTSVAGNIEIGAVCKKGLTYQATGTPLCTIIWN